MNSVSDLTLETMVMCASIDGPKSINVGQYRVDGLFCERRTPTCTCLGFKHRRKCRHVSEAERSVCSWHQQWSNEPQTMPNICPCCGGPTVPIRVAV